jgi:hypothetical protein
MLWDLYRKVFAAVQEVEVTDIVTPDVLDFSQRTITIRTAAGETFDLILQADEPEKLEFKKPEKPNWLTPKVYKPKGKKGKA